MRRRLLLFPLALLASGCREPLPSAAPASAHATAIEVAAERGPVKLVVRADKQHAAVAEAITVTVTVTAPDGVEPKMPEVAEKLGEFAVRDRQNEPVVVEDGWRRWTQQFRIDSVLPGDLSIPAFTVPFTDRATQRPTATAAIQSEIASAPIAIQITSVLGEKFDPEHFRDIKGPVVVPVPANYGWLAWCGGVAAAAGVLWFAATRWRRSQTVAAEVVLPPFEWAMEQLRRLREDDLPGRGAVQEYYSRLSDIVRQYIERRFAIMAPERTTEEFLRETADHPALGEMRNAECGMRQDGASSIPHSAFDIPHSLPSARAHLLEFLVSCDMVKFARYEPDVAVCQDSFTAAEAFVRNTRLDPDNSGISGVPLPADRGAV